MILRIKEHNGKKYYQAWQDGRMLCHLGTLETIVKAMQEWKRKKSRT